MKSFYAGYNLSRHARQEHLEEKMKVPQVSINVWKDLYRAASGFRDLSPWELFDDSMIFGVRDPAGEQIGYCCILGALGEVFALCMYRGSGGLALHCKMQAGEIDPAREDVFAMQNVLMTEFCDRKELKKEDLAVIKKLGLKFSYSSGAPAYPCFRDYAPGFAPWFVSERDARWLTFALRCATDLTETLEEDDSLMEAGKPGHYLVYLPRDNGDKELSWTRKWLVPTLYEEPSLPQISVDEFRLRKIQKQSLKPDSAWEMDIFYLAGGVIQDRDRPYYSRCIMAAHGQSGFVFNVELLSPEQKSHLVLQNIFLDSIEKHGFLPAELHVRDELTWKILKPLTEKLGCQLRLQQNLPAIFEAKEALSEQMRKGFGG